jgi:phosphoribulokinase
MIAVGGDSGTGKTTLCLGLERVFGKDRLEIVSLDDYHSLDRAQRTLVDISALDPRATNFAAMQEDLWALREGRAIEKPVYEHATGTFGPVARTEPKEIIVVHGLFPLYTRAMRSLFDITVWMDPETELKLVWKKQRDMLERGYTAAESSVEIQRRKAEIAKFIEPQMRYADLWVTFYRADDYATHEDPAKLSARIRKGGRFRALDYSEFESPSTSIRQIEEATGRYPETIIELDGHIDRATAETVEDRLWQHIDSGRHERPLLGEFNDAHGKARTGYALALAQLLIARRVVLIEEELLERVQ